MKPKLIIHLSASADGAITGFDPDPAVYYEAANKFNADTILIGSTTALSGIEKYVLDFPPETESDFNKPAHLSKNNSPYWVIIDTDAKLINKLHVFRNADFCKDIILFVSESTPQNYINYLKERNFDYYISGEEKVNIIEAVETLRKNYEAKIIRSDSGLVLNKILLKEKLADELSIVIAPVFASGKNLLMLKNLTEENKVMLNLLECQKLINGYVWIRYGIVY